MRVLGIDPGIARMGWSIVERNGVHLQAIAYGCFETKTEESVQERLLKIHSFLTQLITKQKPERVAVEELFFNTNAKTAFVVGQARGVVLLAAAEFALPVNIYTPLQVKIAMTGYGRAEKKQIGQMVKILLKLPTIPTPDDTTDAIAVGLTCLQSVR